MVTASSRVYDAKKSSLMPKHSITRLFSDLRCIGRVLILVVLIFTGMGSLDVDNFYFDIVSHFPFQYMGAGIIGTVICLMLRAWLFCALSVLVFIGSLSAVYKYPLFPKATARMYEEPSDPSVLIANVNTSNTEYQKFNALIEAARPTVIVLKSEEIPEVRIVVRQTIFASRNV